MSFIGRNLVSAGGKKGVTENGKRKAEDGRRKTKDKRQKTKDKAANGVTTVDDDARQDEGVVRCYANDPFGNRLEFMERR